MTENSINKKIRDYIDSKGIKQTDIANSLKIHQSSLSRTLNSDDLKVSQLIKISKVLMVGPTYFFDGSEIIDKNDLEICKKRIQELEESIHDKRLIIKNLINVELK